MKKPLLYFGQNEFGKHWSLIIPEAASFAPQGDLEVAIVAGKEGVTFGGQLIRWEELDEARKVLNQMEFNGYKVRS